jgi:RES domain-containing protein
MRNAESPEPRPPRPAGMKARLTRLLARTVAHAETVYRASTPRYANEMDLLTGERSRRNGGRCNPIGIAAIAAHEHDRMGTRDNRARTHLANVL